MEALRGTRPVVAKGFSQQFGSNYEETFAPVAWYGSFKILLAIVVQMGWKPQQMDMKTAFIYGTLKEEIYMRLSEGYRMQGKVAQLYKCIYRLKWSARKWYECLSTLLQQIGFLSSEFDPCVFIHIADSTFILTYVDDLGIFDPNNSPFIKKVEDKLSTRFKCKGLGDAHYILGLEITYTPASIDISKTAYIHKFLMQYGMSASQPIATPLDLNQLLWRVEPGTDIVDISEYQSIIGSLMYAVSWTRPDLAFTVTLISQFSSAPNEEHMQYAKRVLQYLSGPVNWSLHYPRSPTMPFRLTYYADTLYANSLNDCKSSSV